MKDKTGKVLATAISELAKALTQAASAYDKRTEREFQVRYLGGGDPPSTYVVRTGPGGGGGSGGVGGSPGGIHPRTGGGGAGGAGGTALDLHISSGHVTTAAGEIVRLVRGAA